MGALVISFESKQICVQLFCRSSLILFYFFFTGHCGGCRKQVERKLVVYSLRKAVKQSCRWNCVVSVMMMGQRTPPSNADGRPNERTERCHLHSLTILDLVRQVR